MIFLFENLATTHHKLLWEWDWEYVNKFFCYDNKTCLGEIVVLLTVVLHDITKASVFFNYLQKKKIQFLAALTKTRVKDVHFQELIEKNHVYTCEKHFLPQEINIRKYQILFCWWHLSSNRESNLYNIHTMISKSLFLICNL